MNILLSDLNRTKRKYNIYERLYILCCCPEYNEIIRFHPGGGFVIENMELFWRMVIKYNLFSPNKDTFCRDVSNIRFQYMEERMTEERMIFYHNDFKYKKVSSYMSEIFRNQLRDSNQQEEYEILEASNILVYMKNSIQS